jgi:hypothetical protein
VVTLALYNPTFTTTLNGIPLAYVDDFFSAFEAKAMLTEMERLKDSFGGPETTGGAVKNGEPLKRAMGLFLRDHYENLADSMIYRSTQKYFSPDLLATLRGKAWYTRYMEDHYKPSVATQVLYYEDSGGYGNHTDLATVTVLCWLHKEPRAFEGGDIVFEETTRIEMRHNRVLFFPSVARHEVTPVKMLQNKDGYGRYCISNFLHTNTGG